MFTPGTVLLHDNLSPDGKSLLFCDPREILIAHTPEEARAALGRIEAAGRTGLWAAGYFAYELGFVFEERLTARLGAPSATPLLWFGIYDRTRSLDPALLEDAPQGAAIGLEPETGFSDYAAAFRRVKSYIAAGDTYQVNLTLRARFTLEGDPLGLYVRLAQAQKTAYGAFIHAGDHHVLSRSPELFVSSVDDTLFARPMKGTMPRAPLASEDAAGRAALAGDEKNRAENLMIVDLLRNDLGRISEIGSVRVTDLFTVETYPTLHTMTSGITAKRRAGIGLPETIENLFPCGSITGAPKLRAMEIIDEVEPGPRGLYTGSIGYIAPGGDFTFNVAIRTAVIDAAGRGTIGIGGGIVADSVAEAEYEEALLKMRFLADPAPPVTLIETLKWSPGEGFVLLGRHIARLLASAAYFGLPCDGAAATTRLLQESAAWTGPMRVRLTLSEKGIDIAAVPLPPNREKFRFLIAEERLQSNSVWLAHKTTNRAFYDEPRIAAHEAYGVDEVVFLNERSELTEGSITNLFIERDGTLLTPPLSSGLLPGTLRAELVETGQARETILTLADLATAEAIFLGNSVRGLLRAELFQPGARP
ncbi:para-aminobenzoate synthetase / 4-amino-4-deoxychorismate lyase [Devosia crocina]|uniref:Probable branched-chain-amino-acid aminotransferase n=1 Tax=Devosia crocina TaxID=429728 RepID=A0A1I7NT26_9HYPH|nr:aminodeoxychorismate synthase component I [Devosia crocina]SFV37748.1 para-aminobenzoate synthetase / 4-amino-4-deoxychorismate lyase [Devosia crocina]